MNYKNGRRPKSVPLAWRATVTTHEELIDRPRDPERPEAGWPENGHDQMGKPWVDAKTWAVARVLDDHMDKDGTCSPSYGTIAEQARISRSTAKYGVARLIGAGLLERRQRRINSSMSESNEYRACWGWAPSRPGGGPPPAPKVDGSSTHSDGEASHLEGCSGFKRRQELCEGLCRKCWADWYVDGRPFGQEDA